jgi:hypothetical protein
MLAHVGGRRDHVFVTVPPRDQARVLEDVQRHLEGRACDLHVRELDPDRVAHDTLLEPGLGVRLALQCTARVESRDDPPPGRTGGEYNLGDATSRPEEESWRP